MARSDRSTGVAVVVAAAGLLVLVVAAAVGSERSDLGHGDVPIIGQVLSGVITGGFFALAAIGAFLLIFRRGRVSRARPTGPVVPWWLRSLVTIGLLILFVVIALLVFGRPPRPERTKPSDGVAKQSQETTATKHRSDGRSGTPIAFYLGAVLAVSAVVIGVARSPRSTAAADVDEDVEPDDLPPKPLRRAVEASLDALEGERDPRRAILAAYARVQTLLASDGLPRRVSETEPEYLTRVLEHYGAAAEPAGRLTELFVWARYGAGEVDERMRRDAIRAARALRDGAAAGAR
ncbi:MAG: DUF4129 domain-containing protein [Acidimicrobiia bacterium]|nr:DUF4129 domain-containing protein [Acidimicrobiia bacterium]